MDKKVEGFYAPVLIAGIALVLRLFALLKYVIQYDEVTSLAFPDFPYSVFFYSPQPTFLYNLLMFSLHSRTASELVLRLPSVLFGVAALYPAYACAARLFDRRAGLITAFLLAVSPLHICFSQEIRMYPVIFFLGCLSSVFFVNALETASLRAWMGVVACNTAAAYLNFSAILVIAAQGCYLLLYRRKYAFQKSLRIACACQLIALVPWGYIFFRQFVFMLQHTRLDKRIFSYLGSVTPLNIFFTLKNFCSGYYSSEAGRNIFFASVSVIIGSGVRRLYASRRDILNMIVLFLLFPMAAMVVFSLFRVIYCDKYFIVSLLFLYVLIAYPLSRARTAIRVSALVLLTVLSFLSLEAYYRNRIHGAYWERPGVVARKEYRKAAEYLRKNLREGDLVVHTSGASTLSFAYYAGPQPQGDFLRGRALYAILEAIYGILGMENRLIFHDVGRNSFRILEENEKFMTRRQHEEFSGFERVWLVFSYWERPEPFQGIMNWFDSHFVPLERYDFDGGRLILYAPGAGL